MIEHLTGIIERCMTNAPNPTAGARLAAYRVTDELRTAMLESDAIWAANKAKTTHMIANMTHRAAAPSASMKAAIAAAWDAVLEEDGNA